MGIIELGEVAIAGEVAPLPLAAACATIETRGAPAALVAIEAASSGRGFARRVVPVHVDAVEAGPLSDDVIAHLVSPDDARDVKAPIEGAGLFAWLPPDPVLRRPSEIVVVALAITYRRGAFKPRELPPLAELVGLDDLGNVLELNAISEGSNQLSQIAGEIRDNNPDPLAGLDDD
jgi:hypothetical protein